MVYALPLLALMACEEEKHTSYAPIFSGFRAVSALADQIELKGELTAGDSIIVTAVQEKTGDYIYNAQYTWSVTYTNGETFKTRTLPVKYTKKVVYDNDKSDPTVRFRLPDTVGTINVGFNAQYDYSSATVILVKGSKGGITVTSSSLLGEANGSKTYSVKKE